MENIIRMKNDEPLESFAIEKFIKFWMNVFLFFCFCISILFDRVKQMCVSSMTEQELQARLTCEPYSLPSERIRVFEADRSLEKSNDIISPKIL